MREFIAYFAVAIVVGLLVVLVPVVAFIGIEAEDHVNYLSPQTYISGLKGLEGTSKFGLPRVEAADSEILIFSFVVALVTYLLAKRRRPSRDYGFVRLPP